MGAAQSKWDELQLEVTDLRRQLIKVQLQLTEVQRQNSDLQRQHDDMQRHNSNMRIRLEQLEKSDQERNGNASKQDRRQDQMLKRVAIASRVDIAKKPKLSHDHTGEQQQQPISLLTSSPARSLSPVARAAPFSSSSGEVASLALDTAFVYCIIIGTEDDLIYSVVDAVRPDLLPEIQSAARIWLTTFNNNWPLRTKHTTKSDVAELIDAF